MTIQCGFMFAGQGAQAVGMGKDLYENSAAAKTIFDRADEVLGSKISEICFEGPQDALTASENCQPAIYTMSMACLAAAKERVDISPVVSGGLSLGEFAAIAASGVVSFEEGLKLVAERGKLFAEACSKTNGGMAAVLNADAELLEKICGENDVDIANFNCPGQTVISGEKENVEKAAAALGEAGVKRVILLDVDGAFHSRLMKEAGEKFGAVLNTVSITAPSDGLLVQNVIGDFAKEPDVVRDNLRRQVSGSVRWQACVEKMLEQNIDMLIEFGPGQVLKGFMRRIDRKFPVLNVGTAADLDTLAEKLA